MDKEKINKPIELIMSELRNKIINDCAESGMNLFFINSVIEGIYREINVQYTNDANNRIQEYNKYLESEKTNQKKK